ncbi:RNA polymerase sigma factor [Tenacibaculum sp. 190524A02b]|uniref:RNA polymerase sigma factor n=1 Tax=Tenacibaculum vairaonense TaxID=3137860 RepID=UPI0031FB0F2A
MKNTKQSLCAPEVFEDVYKANVQTLRNHIYYKCGDIDLAEDIVHDCFMKIWNNCAEVILTTVTAFLFKIANNAFLNSMKKKKIILKHEKLIKKDTVTIEHPQFIMEEKEFLKKLQEAIADLSDKEREVFLLNRIDKKKYREIAVLLDISIKTVEKRMMGALKKLRQTIEGI